MSLHARFPGASFISQAEFMAFRQQMQDRLDARHVHELAQVSGAAELIMHGTCAPCLRRAIFTSPTAHWARELDGRAIADWAEALACDCADRLSNRARAVVHFAQSLVGLAPWTRLLLFGPSHDCHARLARMVGATIAIEGMPNLLPLAAEDGAFHLVVAVECFHRIPPLPAVLVELRRVLAPGGSLIFTAPFLTHAAHSVSYPNLPPKLLRQTAHDFGWDLLDWLREAGFDHAQAHTYWSAELGYLGPFNMIFHAFCS